MNAITHLESEAPLSTQDKPLAKCEHLTFRIKVGHQFESSEP